VANLVSQSPEDGQTNLSAYLNREY
jgi:hypothetical protein